MCEPAATVLSNPTRLRILCFGNALHGDDGFGPAVAERLRQSGLPPRVEVIDCGIRGLDALGFFEACDDVVLVDAAAGTAPDNVPGQLHRYSPATLPREHAPSATLGSHGSGIGALLDAVACLVHPSPRITVLAATLAELRPFTPALSTPIRSAVDDTVATIRTEWFAQEAGRAPD